MSQQLLDVMRWSSGGSCSPLVKVSLFIFLSKEVKAFGTVDKELGMILPILQPTKVRLQAVKDRTKSLEEAKACPQEGAKPHGLSVLSCELGAQ